MDIALFSPSSLFADQDNSSSDDEKPESHENYVERKHQFPGMELLIREFSFHQLNANLLWPGTFAFAEWLVQHVSFIEGRHIIELGSGTGALAIFLRKSYQLDITTSDFNDMEIEENIAYNCHINGITPALSHIKPFITNFKNLQSVFNCLPSLCFPRKDSETFGASIWWLGKDRLQYSWGETFPNSNPNWDLIIASDILLYVKQYPKLIKTLCFLLKNYKPKSTNPGTVQIDKYVAGLRRPAFLMSWRRRIGKEDESLFFSGCEQAGLEVKHIDSRVYYITPHPNK